MQTIILASGSPRRKALMQEWAQKQTPPPQIKIVPPLCDEHYDTDWPPERVARELALRKGRDVAARYPDESIVAADTIVTLDGVIYGKPVDEADARAMLQKLSGRTHAVLTGLYVRYADGREFSSTERADVTFGVITPLLLDWYVATGEPFDKAGAYGAQGDGAKLIDTIDGDPTCVIGLPMIQLNTVLTELL